MTKVNKIIVTRFPFESQLGGEELHTFEVVDYLMSQAKEVFFLTSCPVLRKFAHKRQIPVRKVWLYKPPVSAFSLFVFTLLSPVLLIWSFLICGYYKIKFGRFAFYSLSFTEKLLFAPWCWLFRIPTLWIEHARIANWFHKNPWKIWYKFWGKEKPIKIVTVSERMKTDIGMEQVLVIPNAIDTTEFSKLHDASVMPEEVLNALRAKKIDVGYIGRLSEDKGMQEIIKLANEFKEIGFITIGSGKYKNQLIENDVANIPYLSREQIAAFLQNIDLFILPATKTDPFGLVVLEAMAAGCPVLITSNVGICDYLNHDEIEICEVENLSKTFGNLIQNPDRLKRLSNNGKLVVERFDINQMLSRYLKLIDSI
jgi:glycosyltransferase involved in cell wall biosynthesis